MQNMQVLHFLGRKSGELRKIVTKYIKQWDKIISEIDTENKSSMDTNGMDPRALKWIKWKIADPLAKI